MRWVNAASSARPGRCADCSAFLIVFSKRLPQVSGSTPAGPAPAVFILPAPHQSKEVACRWRRVWVHYARCAPPANSGST